MISARVIISGFVQGVGYRHFVKGNAETLGLSGWVKNLPDGRVEAIFQGSKENIERMIQLCRKGSFLSEVENLEVEWREEDKIYGSFEIIL